MLGGTLNNDIKLRPPPSLASHYITIELAEKHAQNIILL